MSEICKRMIHFLVYQEHCVWHESLGTELWSVMHYLLDNNLVMLSTRWAVGLFSYKWLEKAPSLDRYFACLVRCL